METQVTEYTNTILPLELLQNPSMPTVEGASSFVNQDRKILSQLAAILDDGYVFKSSNLDLGEIELRKGKKSTGLTHIIVRRFQEKVLSKKDQISSSQAIEEITAISFLIAKSLENCPATVTPRGNWKIENQGIVAVIDKDKFGKFVLTGFEWNEKKQEATESISTVIAQYGYTPEFLEMYAQVGAVLTSYGFSLKHNTTSVNTSLEQGTTNNAHQAGKGVYMSNEFAELEDQYLEQMANGGASDRALEEGYLEQEAMKGQQEQENQERDSRKDIYGHGDASDSQKKPYYQQQAENLLEAVKTGRVPFLPQDPVLGEDGRMVHSGNYSQDGDRLVITPRPAVRMLSGNVLTGINQLTAQAELEKAGRKSQTVLTFEQASKEGLRIRRGAKSFVLTGYDKNAEDGQHKARVYHVFAAGDVTDSKPIQGALNKNANANAPKPWTKEVLGCHDGNPVKFLGTYMAASSTGAKFETTMETIQQFKQQFTQMMEKSIAERQHTAIFEVGRNAQKYASAIRDNGFKQWENANNREKEANTRSLQERARGMEMGL